jgi:hypothetical protein
MRSECMAALPQSACCYTWKLPATPHMRPVLLDQSHDAFSRAGAKLRRETCRAEHPSIPWKAYLASREFQNLASDLAEAVFAPAVGRLPAQDKERPVNSIAASRVFNNGAGDPSSGALAPVLADGESAPREDEGKSTRGFALAA